MNLEPKKVRKELESRNEPYWQKFPVEVMKGAALGFRKSPETGVETWHVRVYCEGKYLPRGNLGTVTAELNYREAYTAALAWAQEKKLSGNPVARSYTLEDVVDEYLTHLQGSSNRRNMDRRRQAEKRLNALLTPALKRKKVNALTPQDITKLQREYSQRRHKQGRLKGQLISPDSVNRVFVHLVACLNHAYRQGMVESDKTWKHYKRLPSGGEKRREKQYIPVENREAFLKACPEALRAICTAMNFMAARPSEVRRLRTSDVDLREGRVKLITYKGNNGGSARYFPLPEGTPIRELFEKQIAGKDATDFVFTTETGKNWRQANLAKHHDQVRDEGKFSKAFETYAWRHARLTDWAKQFPAPEVARICGTSLEHVQKNYYKPDEKIRAAMAGM